MSKQVFRHSCGTRAALVGSRWFNPQARRSTMACVNCKFLAAALDRDPARRCLSSGGVLAERARPAHGASWRIDETMYPKVLVFRPLTPGPRASQIESPFRMILTYVTHHLHFTSIGNDAYCALWPMPLRSQATCQGAVGHSSTASSRSHSTVRARPPNG